MIISEENPFKTKCTSTDAARSFVPLTVYKKLDHSWTSLDRLVFYTPIISTIHAVVLLIIAAIKVNFEKIDRRLLISAIPLFGNGWLIYCDHQVKNDPKLAIALSYENQEWQDPALIDFFSRYTTDIPPHLTRDRDYLVQLQEKLDSIQILKLIRALDNGPRAS